MFRKIFLPLCLLSMPAVYGADLFSENPVHHVLEGWGATCDEEGAIASIQNGEAVLELSGQNAFKIRLPKMYKDRLLKISFDVQFEEDSADLRLAGYDFTELDPIYVVDEGHCWMKLPKGDIGDFQKDSVFELDAQKWAWCKIRKNDGVTVHEQDEPPQEKDYKNMLLNGQRVIRVKAAEGVHHVEAEFSPISGDNVRLYVKGYGNKPQFKVKITNMRLEAVGFSEMFDGSTFRDNPRKALRWLRYQTQPQAMGSPMAHAPGLKSELDKDQLHQGFSLPLTFENVGENPSFTCDVSAQAAMPITAGIILRDPFQSGKIVNIPSIASSQVVIPSLKHFQTQTFTLEGRDIFDAMSPYHPFVHVAKQKVQAVGKFDVQSVVMRYGDVHVKTPADLEPLIDESNIDLQVQPFTETLSYNAIDNALAAVEGRVDEFAFLTEAQRQAIRLGIEVIRENDVLRALWENIWHQYVALYQELHAPHFIARRYTQIADLFEVFNAKTNDTDRLGVLAAFLAKLSV